MHCSLLLLERPALAPTPAPASMPRHCERNLQRQRDLFDDHEITATFQPSLGASPRRLSRDLRALLRRTAWTGARLALQKRLRRKHVPLISDVAAEQPESTDLTAAPPLYNAKMHVDKNNHSPSFYYRPRSNARWRGSWPSGGSKSAPAASHMQCVPEV